MQTRINYTIGVGALIALFFTTRISYLLFHTLVEIFSIVIAFSIFVIAWNSEKYIKNPYLLFVGIGYLFIASLDLLHTMAFPGLPLFADNAFYANQLWIAARYLESITLLVAFGFLTVDRRPRTNLVFAIYLLATAVLAVSILYWKIFPECFVEGEGQTLFKILSEYLICVILLAAIYLLTKNREKFSEKIFNILLASIVCTIISELSFTLYVDNHGFMNLVGHYFKIFSFSLIYVALIQTGIEEPFDLIFRDLDLRNSELQEEIVIRRKTEEEKERLIRNLTQALEEIKTLQGLLPICLFCKKIRDDKGYWSNLETYFSAHSKLEFSHGLCPECAQEHYPECFEPAEESS